MTTANLISKTIGELNALMDEADELREQMIAQGVQMQTINVLVEMGFHDRGDDNDTLIKSALEGAEKTYGQGAISQQELTDLLEQLVAIEKDIAARRRSAKQQGLDLQAINFLARIIRQNPGDGGELAINKLVAYSRACDIPLSGIDQIVQKFDAEPASVLPNIARPVENHADLRLLWRDVSIGLFFAVVLMALMVG